MNVAAILPPPNALGDWRALDLDARTLDRISPIKLAEYLVDISPDVSRALFDFLRECNAGWSLDAFRPGEEEVADPSAQVALDAIVARLRDLYGTPDVPINRLFIAAWLRGALLSELVLGADGRTFVDLATPDPAIVRFKQIADPERGTVYQAGQMQGGAWVAFDLPTISYIPVDPLPGSPYGRPLVAPALFVTLFLIGLLHDLRRVIAQQGYPRLDIKVIQEMVLAGMFEEERSDPEKVNERILTFVDQVANYYAQLEPDSAFVHTDVVEMGKPVGTVGADALGGVGQIIEALERMAVRALKTVPFMMALTESTTESQANRQFEQHAIAIRSMQHLVETQLERLFTLALQAQGIVTTVRMRFTENRASEEQRDEQVKQLKIANAGEGYQLGFLSQDEAANYAFDKDVADVPEPRGGAQPAAPAPQSQQNPDPSASRAQPAKRRDRRPKLIPLGHDQPFDPLEPVVITDDDLDRAVEIWDQKMPKRVNGLLDATVVNGEAE
jgi:hypothetical protein